MINIISWSKQLQKLKFQAASVIFSTKIKYANMLIPFQVVLTYAKFHYIQIRQIIKYKSRQCRLNLLASN